MSERTDVEEVKHHTLQNTPALRRLMDKMDDEVVATFTEKQLNALGDVIEVQRWRKHGIDIRTTLVFPFLPWSFYTVFLAGRNRRYLSSSEQMVAAGMLMLMLILMGISVFGFIVTILYLLKSAMGIDLFPDESLGIWDEFKRMFD
ncbi:MAG: 3-phosphoshikimate 1-carboxyvinyltransferase [Kangiellaceae bacterium]|nr:3-phosphoshikimate 1-carboxyvinyltransferase [Kangiellaceae bacterium]